MFFAIGQFGISSAALRKEMLPNLAEELTQFQIT